jgi:hypothetical protein
MLESLVPWFLKSVVGGCIGYIAQQCLRNAHRRLRRLQSKPLQAEKMPLVTPESSDADLEEVLTHLCDQYCASDELSIRESAKIVYMSWVEIPMTYSRLVIIRVVSKGRAGGA